MSLNDIYDFVTSPRFHDHIFTAIVLTIFAVMTLLQMSKLPVNPWSWVAVRVGRAINAELFVKFEELNKRLDVEKKERQEDKVSNMRRFLLEFAQECRRGLEHDKEQWTYVLNKAKEYEGYCKDNEIENGVIEEDTKYIRNLYFELSRDHKL